jgi:hypothetical protein
MHVDFVHNIRGWFFAAAVALGLLLPVTSTASPPPSSTLGPHLEVTSVLRDRLRTTSPGEYIDRSPEDVLRELGTELLPPAVRDAFRRPASAGPFDWDGARHLDQGDHYNVLVIGDSLATGLHAGLVGLLGQREDINLIRQSKRSTGLVNDGYYDWPRQARRLANQYRIDAAVIALGANDRMNMVTDDGVHRLLGDAWKADYTDRINRVIAALKQDGAAIYWMGMPIVEDEEFARKMKGLNTLYRQQADEQKIRYISAWDRTATDTGKVKETYLTPDGTRRRLRLHDGVHFTWNGYNYLARPLASWLLHDFGLRPLEEGR